MKIINISLQYLTLASAALSSASWANVEHTFDFGARARYTDIEVADNKGKAASLLLRASLESRWTDSFSSLLEIDAAETWFQDEHRDGLRFNNKPRVPDVPGNEVNQAFLQWDGRQLSVTAGRQRIELANQRFISSVSFWQNDQTYDALRSTYNFLSASSAQYIYIDNVNRFWGDDAEDYLRPSDVNFAALDGIRPAGARGDHAQNTHLAHLELKEWDYSQWLAWYYSIENETFDPHSNDTAGIGYRFNYKGNNLKYIVEADIAQQERTAFEKNSMSYYRLEAGIEIQSTEFMLSQESLGSDNGVAFIAPLGSINDFQGWADVFFNTPANGLVDTRLQIDWRFNPFRIDLRYHNFQAAEGGEDYGTELDIDVLWKPAKKQQLLLRLSDFNSDTDSLEDNVSLSLTWSYNI